RRGVGPGGAGCVGTVPGAGGVRDGALPSIHPRQEQTGARTGRATSMIAVTGANGFVGAAVVAALARSGRAVRPLGRASGADMVAVGDIGPDTDWSQALQGVTCVIHCAARVHVMKETQADALAA